MNAQDYPLKMGFLSTHSASILLSKLHRLSNRLNSLGYPSQDITRIILKTFLQIPHNVDWLKLQNTQLFYSLKAKIQFDLKDVELVVALSKYFLSYDQCCGNLAAKLLDRLEYRCEVLGFDLELEDSGSSEDSQVLLGLYKVELGEVREEDQERTKGKVRQREREIEREREKPPPRKRLNVEAAKNRKRVSREKQTEREKEQQPNICPLPSKISKKEDNI